MHSKWILLFLLSDDTAAFAPQSRRCRRETSSTFLRGFNEWRATELSTKNTDYAVHDNESSSSSSTLRPVSILPKEYTKNVPLPGETTYLQFVGDTESRIFEMTLEQHEGIFAVGFVSSDEVDVERTMLATLPLLEIQEYNNMGRELGIFCVARVVGKAKVHQVFWSRSDETTEPFQALVYDSDDDFQKSDIIAANQVADGIELLVSYLARLETASSEEYWDEDEEALPTMRDLFLEAYEAALRSDPQEYNIPLDGVHTLGQRSWRELKAMSWAAFACSEQQPWRHLEALYTSDTLRRLQLARNWLSGIRIPAPERVR
jgi:hypothetical protein